MSLSRLDNFLRSVRGTVIFVDPNNLDATDSIDNNGASQVRPLKTIQRALLEASRFSYQRGLDNDRFEKTSIIIYPGEHLIDNRPGWIPNGPEQSDPTLTNFILRGGVTSNNFFPFDGTTNFNLETDDNELYKLNSIYGGVIVPRGVSLVGIDLRKTKIRPRYVPNPENDNIERTAIFRLTGGSFFWNFTVFDALPSGQAYQDYTLNKRLSNYSHNKLSVFEYADGTNPVSISDQFVSYSTDRTDLDMYYEKVSIAYGTASNRSINPTFPEPGIDIQAITGEFEIVGSKGEEFIVRNIFSGDGEVSSDIITVELNRPVAGLNVNTAIRVQGVPTPGYDGSYVITEIVGPETIRYRAATTPPAPNPNILGVTVVLNVVVDTVNSASPYIFNVSLRSVFGMCGIHADGDKADGFKSVVIAQFTGIGLQKDNNAFIRYSQNAGIYEDSTIVPNLSSDSRAIYKPKYENYHIKASNDAFMQLVSVFAIGFAKQFVVESGGDFSVTNSNSNFGAKALVSSGFKRQAFPQDDVGYITHIIPPRKIESEEITLNFNSIDVGLTTSVGSPNRLYLYEQTNFDIPPENVIDGYRIGAKRGETLSVIINQEGSSQIATSEIVMQVPPPVAGIINETSVKVYTVALDGNNLPNIDNETNIVTLETPHDLQNGEKIRILSNTAFLPNGIDANEIYYAITFIIDDPITLGQNQIKIAKTFNDAIRNIPININNNGQFLRIESRVSDKLTGEIGHPIQWDPSQSNWYITTNPTNNEIYNLIETSGQASLGDTTSRTFFKRTPDDRNLIDTVYRYRYVLPKDTPISARSPIDGFVIQESNDTISRSNAEIRKYFDINRISSILDINPYELKNFRLISSGSWNNGVATFITELPHDLGVLSEVEINNIISTENLQGLYAKGFNGKFTVVNVSDRKTFSVIMPINPGTFTNNVSVRNTNLPFFKRSRYKDTYSIYKKEEIQEYVPGEIDGIYHLFVVTNSISPSIEPFTSLKLSQPIENFYPQRNRDNPRSDVNFANSFALPDPIGKVIINDVESSITSETINRFASDVNIGFSLNDIQSNSDGIQHSIFTTIDHGLNRITRLSIQSGGDGYGTGTGPETEIFYNAQLVGSSTGEGATAVVKVESSIITDILLMDGGSGYEVGQELTVVGIPTTIGFTPAEIQVSDIYDNIDSNFRIEGIFASPFNAYNGVYRITGVPNSRRIEAVSDAPKFADIPGVGQIPIIDENPTGLAQISPIILKSATCITSGESIQISQYSYSSNTGIATITTINSNGFKVDGIVITTGFADNFFNGEFSVKKVNSVTQLEIFVGRGGGSSPTITLGQQYLNRSGFIAGGGSITAENEETAGRLSPRYGNLSTTLTATINNTQDEISINNLNKLDLKLGDYLIIDYEIMRINSDVLSTNPIKVFRGLLGTTRRSHVANSYIERINIFPIEFRRNSVIRASGHTFEYVGYGPGNYSTTLPERQNRVLSKAEESLTQSFKVDGGINVYNGMNDAGNFYIGNRRISSTSGREEIFNAPIPTVTGEDPTGSNNFGFDLISPDEVRVERSIKVEGGANNNLISEFDGPVVFNNNITARKNIESSGLLLKGDANVSRNYTVKLSEPLVAGNPGDVVFDANPEKRGEVGWVYTTENKWQRFGLIRDEDTYYGNFEGNFSGSGSGLTGVSDIWVVDNVGIHTLSNVGIGTNTALEDFVLHIFGGIKANGISEFNSQQLTFNIPTLLNFNAIDTRVNQNFSVIGVSTFSNNINIRTTANNTNGRSIRFVQTDSTIVNGQGYGDIEWEGFDTGNTGVRGYIRGVSEGTQGQFALSFGTQPQGDVPEGSTILPEERLRIASNGNVIFRRQAIAPEGFVGNLTGVANTATDAILTRVNPDTLNADRFITFVGGSDEGFYNQRSSNKLRFNPSTGNLTATSFTGTIAGSLPIGGIIMWSGSISNIPSGWSLCNGANGTPDLRNRFIVGAGQDYNPGNTGGSNFITLTVAEIPVHSHTGSTASAGAHEHTGTAASAGSHAHSGTAASNGAHAHTGTAASAGAHAHTGTAASAGAHAHTGTAASAGGHNHSGSTGGAGAHSHSGSANSAGAHTHTYTTYGRNDYALGNNSALDRSAPQTATTSSAGAHGHSLSINGVGDHAHGLSINSGGAHTHSLTINSAGAHTHNLTINSAGAHTHSITTNNTGAHTHSITTNNTGAHTHSITTNNTGAHIHTVTVGNTGGGAAHENRPPYYALAFIMRTS
jgi:microcystin-dependent protein